MDLQLQAKHAKAHHDKAVSYGDKAEQHAKSCGLTISKAFEEIDRLRAEQPRGDKKAVMGRGEWLRLSGIPTQRASEYLRIADGSLSMRELRAHNAAPRGIRATTKSPGGTGKNGTPPDHTPASSSMSPLSSGNLQSLSSFVWGVQYLLEVRNSGSVRDFVETMEQNGITTADVRQCIDFLNNLVEGEKCLAQ